MPSTKTRTPTRTPTNNTNTQQQPWRKSSLPSNIRRHQASFVFSKQQGAERAPGILNEKFRSSAMLPSLKRIPPSRLNSHNSLKSSLRIKSQHESIEQPYSSAGYLNPSRQRKLSSQDDGGEEKQQEEMPLSLRFSNVTVHYHQIIMGDYNPWMRTEGPPLSMGWERVAESKVYATPQDFEEQRMPRPRDEIQLSSFQRQELLLRSGVTRQELKERLNENKKQQQETERHSPLRRILLLQGRQIA